jgi:nucleoside-diphosphate kinase
MAIEKTLAIIKPDAVGKGQQGEILCRIHNAGFRIVGIKSARLSRAEAEGFYAVHRGKGFFSDLCDFMSSGQCIIMVLEAEDAIKKWRDVMGATNPANAAPGTIRRDLAESVQNNCVHGSDAPETAAFEIGYFFSAHELL